MREAFAGTLPTDGVVEDLGPDLSVDVPPGVRVPLVQAQRAARDLVPVVGRRPFVPGELHLPELTGAEVADSASAPGGSLAVVPRRARAGGVDATLVLLPAASPSSVAAWMDRFRLHDDPAGRGEFGAALEERSARRGAEVVADDGTSAMRG